MRIRKRWPPPPPPPPSSSLPPNKQFAPDLPTSKQQQLSSSSSSIGAATSESRRALHHHSDLSLKPNNNHCPPWETPNQLLRQSKEHDLHRSNLQLAMIRGANGWICSNGERDEVDKEKEKEKKNMKLKKGDCMHQCPIQIEESGAETVVIVVGVEEEEEGAKEEKKLATIHRRNKNNFGAETSLGVSISSSSSQQVGRWGEGEKVFPLKKRRGSFEGKVIDNMILEKEKKTKTKMKTKTNKKWVHAEEEEEEDQRSADGQTISASSVIVKKRGSGGTIMEGSRCSRVNGRGWRCCQQTLVGYSLCEHHLGKGRLRSMSSVRHRSSTIIKPKKEKEEEEEEVQLSSLQSQKSLEYVEEEEEEEDEKPLLITKKRKKIGMVKARSISSLLSQTQTHAISVTSQAPADNNHSNSSNVHDM